MIAASALLLLAPLAQGPRTGPPPTEPPKVEEVRAAIGRGLAFLLKDQNEDGSWGGPRNPAHEFWSNPETHRSWTVGTTGLVCMALFDLGGGPEVEAAIGRGLDYVTANADLQRPSDWDIDNTWGFIYGLQSTSKALSHKRFAVSPKRAAWRKAAEGILADLARYQSPNGGWGYYADSEAGWRPEWATSFMTAAGVLALLDAKAAGLAVDAKVFDKAVKAVERCRLPNGAYSYSVMAVPSPAGLEFINQVKGSLGRIQVCNLALHRAGAGPGVEEMKRGVALFFEHHKFLDVARMRPIPHEAYYANAGYFYFFGHHYAAQVIEALPAQDRAAWWPRLQREILKTQDPDGSMWDFYISSYHKPWGTSYGVMALGKSLGPEG